MLTRAAVLWEIGAPAERRGGRAGRAAGGRGARAHRRRGRLPLRSARHGRHLDVRPADGARPRGRGDRRCRRPGRAGAARRRRGRALVGDRVRPLPRVRRRHRPRCARSARTSTACPTAARACGRAGRISATSWRPRASPTTSSCRPRRRSSCPEGADLEVAALIGCAAMTGVGAVFNTAGVRPGERAVVFGCGGVGQCIVQGLRAAGAYPDRRGGRDRGGARAGARLGRDRHRARGLGRRPARDQAGDAAAARTSRSRRSGCRRRSRRPTRRWTGGGRAVIVGMPARDATITINAFSLAGQGLSLDGLAVRLVAAALRRAAAGRAGGGRAALARLADRAPLPARRDQRAPTTTCAPGAPGRGVITFAS